MKLFQEKRRRTQHGTSSSPLKATPGAPATNTADADATTAAPSTKQSTPPPQLPRDVAIRRLRALGQPATLFGEDDDQRLLRLQKMERDVALVDEARGGQQENFYLEIKRQEKLKKGSVGGEAGKKADKKQKDGEVRGCMVFAWVSMVVWVCSGAAQILECEAGCVVYR